MRAFVGLPLGERLVLAYGVVLLVVVKLAVRLVPLRSLDRGLAVFGRLRRAGTGSPDEVIASRVRLLETACAIVPRSGNCLVRALALRTLLAHRGVPSSVRIGFATDASGVMEGHAWLQGDGRVLVGEVPDLARFAVSQAPLGATARAHRVVARP